MRRPAAGVAGMRVRAGDEVVSMALSTNPEAELLTVLSSGYGKRTTTSEYRKTRRGSKGARPRGRNKGKGGAARGRAVHPKEKSLERTKGGSVSGAPSADTA